MIKPVQRNGLAHSHNEMNSHTHSKEDNLAQISKLQIPHSPRRFVPAFSSAAIGMAVARLRMQSTLFIVDALLEPEAKSASLFLHDYEIAL